MGWLKLCEIILKGKLDEAETALFKSGIGYISQHKPDQTNLFDKKIDWPDARTIAQSIVVFDKSLLAQDLHRDTGGKDQKVRVFWNP